MLLQRKESDMTEVDSVACIAETNEHAVMSGSKQAWFRIVDIGGLIYLGGVSALILMNIHTVMALTKVHPLVMGFIKFALLATFGECLKTRIQTGTWIPSKLPLRVVIWGCFGMWISLSFPFVDGGLKALIALHEWPSWPQPFWMAMWINFFGGYAFFMMLSHYWVDTMVLEGPIWPWEVMGRPGAGRWAKIVLLAIIFFWTPVHMVTFSLPPLWRTLWAAYISMAIGLILSFAAGRRTKSA
jgi:hypothetical protein